MFRLKKVKYTIKQSQEPTKEEPYIVFFESSTKRGFNCGKIFGGTRQECQEVLDELTKGKSDEQ